jgi:hypothetical protein
MPSMKLGISSDFFPSEALGLFPMYGIFNLFR